MKWPPQPWFAHVLYKDLPQERLGERAFAQAVSVRIDRWFMPEGVLIRLTEYWERQGMYGDEFTRASDQWHRFVFEEASSRSE